MDDNNIPKSYYVELLEFYKNNKGELYKFQDLQKAGNYEYRVFTGKIEPFKLLEQNKIAVRLVKILLYVIYNNKDYGVIEEFLQKNKIIHYYESFRQTLSAVIESDNSIKAIFEELTDTIIFCSRSDEMIKMALIMAQVLERDNLERILDVFSIHNDFLFYVINDYSHIKNHNQKIFEIAKRSKAYGKLFALSYLKASTCEIEDWLMQKGCIDEYEIPEIAECSFLSIDLLEYFDRVDFDSFDMELFGKYFSEMLSGYGLDALDCKVGICNKILEIINEGNGGVYSLYTVISILYTIDGMITDYYKKYRNTETLPDYEEYNKIIELCSEIYKKSYWHDVIKKEIDNNQVEPDVLIMCIEKTGYKLGKREYENILKRNYLSPLLYEYGLCEGSKSIKKAAFKLAIANLPIEDMTTGAGEIRMGNLTYDDMPYICFYILVKHIDVKDFKDNIEEYKDICLTGLKCPLIEVREECVKNLNTMKEFLSERDKNLINKCIDKESIPNIKRYLKILSMKEEELNKNKHIITKRQENIEIHPKDAFLCDINILGEDDFDRIKVKKSLEERKVLYIDENPIGESNFSAVACIASGYVIGYIEKPVDDILNNLIKAKRHVYGIIKQVSDNCDSIIVSLYLSYKDVEDGVSDILSLLAQADKQYIQ